MRLWPVVLVGVLVLAALGGWWFTRPAVRGSSRLDGSEGPGAPTTLRARDVARAPRRLEGRVVDEKGTGLQATVTLYASAITFEDAKCPVCDLPERACEAPETAAHVAETLRAGLALPPVVREVETAIDGAFTLEDVAPGAVLLVRAEGRVGRLSSLDADLQALELRALEDLEFRISGEDAEEPRTDAKVTVFEPVFGTRQRLAPDRDGVVTLRSADPLAWVFIEAPGALPWGGPLVSHRAVSLTGPGVLVVKTVRDGVPVDAEVTVEVSRHPRTLRTTKGVARFEGLPRHVATVTARDGELVSGNHQLMLRRAENELVVELFPSGSLVLSLESEDGEPIDDGYVSLSAPVFSGEQEIKPGALVIFERLPAGDYELGVDGRDLVRDERRVEVVGGRETRLAVTLRRPLLLTGTVVDARGAPVADTNITVVDENGDGVDGRERTVGDRFEVQVPHAGTFVVRAGSPLLGEGEAAATVPGPPVQVRVKPRAVLEVRLRTDEGEDLVSSITLRPKEGWRRHSLEHLDGGWARNASLEAGEYELTAEPWGYLPLKRAVQLEEGKTVRLELTLERGATISGRVEREPGAVAYQVTTDERGGYVSAPVDEEDGTFELRGVPPGALELLTCHGDGTQPRAFPVEAPSRGVVVRCPTPKRSHGRVIDQRGAPVKRFHVNDREISGGDGRFEITWTGQVTIFAQGYSTFSLLDAGLELGDLTLVSEPLLEGEVVNAAGAPVSGATVTVRRGDVVRSDSRGRFQVPLREGGDVQVYASLGGLSGTAKGRAGDRVRVVLNPPVRVTGHIVDRQSQPVVATISAESDNRRVEFRSDAQGNFAGELEAGVWIFTSRLLDGTRAVNIAAPTTHVSLGRSAESCGITVEAPGRKLSVGWLLPEKPASLDVEPEPVANAVVAMARNDMLVFTGVPCGAYSVVVAFVNPESKPGRFQVLDSLKPGYASELMTLRGNDERLVLPPP